MNIFNLLSVVLIGVAIWLSNKNYQDDESKKSGWNLSIVLFVLAALLLGAGASDIGCYEYGLGGGGNTTC